MGDNITFRMNVGDFDGDIVDGPHSILEPRLLFKVAAAESEYGDGTPHPMKVTIAELYELVFGVKDAWFTAGTADFGYFGVGTYYSLAVTTIDPEPPLTAGDEDPGVDPTYESYFWTYTRGYCVVSDDAPPAFVASLFQAPYNTYTYATGNYSDCYDIGDSEAGMWLFDDDVDAGLFHFNGTPPGVLVTAFSHIHYYLSLYAIGIPYSSVYGIYAYESGSDFFYTCFSQVSFSREVKIVDNMGNGDPYDPGNDLYLGVRFRTDSEGLPYGAGWLDTDKQAIEDIYAYYVPGDPPEEFPVPTEAYDTGLKFKIVLKASTIECALYAGLAEGPGETSSFEGGTDWVMTAKKWWKFRRPDGGDMYDEDTGADL